MKIERPAGRAWETEDSVLGRTLRILGSIEDALLVLLLGAMIVLAAWQIVARNLFDTAILWGDPLLRILVLWVGFLGAVAAGRDDRQINVDVVSRVVDDPRRSRIRVVTDLFTAVISGFLAWHGTRFVQDARLYDEVAFGSVPVWITASVLPIAFGLLSLRYLLLTAFHLRRGFSEESAQ